MRAGCSAACCCAHSAPCAAPLLSAGPGAGGLVGTAGCWISAPTRPCACCRHSLGQDAGPRVLGVVVGVHVRVPVTVAWRTETCRQSLSRHTCWGVCEHPSAVAPQAQRLCACPWSTRTSAPVPHALVLDVAERHGQAHAVAQREQPAQPAELGDGVLRGEHLGEVLRPHGRSFMLHLCGCASEPWPQTKPQHVVLTSMSWSRRSGKRKGM